MSDQTQSKFNKFGNFNKEKGERPQRQSFDKSRSRFNNDNKDGGKDRKPRTDRGFNRRDDNDHHNKRQRVQSEKNWVESSEHTRVNTLTGELKWKEEYWTNEAPLVHMKEVKIGKSGDKIYVPSTWKFQNMKAGTYTSSDGSVFMYESAYLIHEKKLS